MAEPFRRLIECLPAERRGRIEATTDALIEEYRQLGALRLDRNMTQAERQASISKFENQGDDIRLGTLRRYVKALGGELEISLRFPDEDLEEGS